MEQSDYNQILDLIYDAAVDSAQWPTVLSRFAGLVGASGGSLIKQNEFTGEAEGVAANLDPAAYELYRDYFATHNILAQSENPWSAPDLNQ